MNCIFMFYFSSDCYRGAITVIEDLRLSVFIVRDHVVSSLWIANWMIFFACVLNVVFCVSFKV